MSLPDLHRIELEIFIVEAIGNAGFIGFSMFFLYGGSLVYIFVNIDFQPVTLWHHLNPGADRVAYFIGSPKTMILHPPVIDPKANRVIGHTHDFQQDRIPAGIPKPYIIGILMNIVDKGL